MADKKKVEDLKQEAYERASLTLETIGGTRSWVARITGTDPKFGFERKFLVGIRDYSKANSVHTRGVMTTFELADGLYEVNSPESWKRTERYFAVVRGGKIERVDVAAARKLATRRDDSAVDTLFRRTSS